LRSGWAWGQGYLENGIVAAEARVGAGKVLLFGPEILQRGQPHGTFKFLFNGIYYAVALPVSSQALASCAAAGPGAPSITEAAVIAPRQARAIRLIIVSRRSAFPGSMLHKLGCHTGAYSSYPAVS